MSYMSNVLPCMYSFILSGHFFFLHSYFESQDMAELLLHFEETETVTYDDTWVIVQLSRAACLSNTYSQVLRCEGPQASQVSPGGGAVELLNLLY